MGTKIVSIAGRMSFPALVNPKADQNGVEKWSLTLLIPKDGSGVPGDDIGNVGGGMVKMTTKEFMAGVKAAIDAAAAEKWPDANKRPKKLRLAIHDGDTWEYSDDGVDAGKLKKDKYPEFAGCWCITATNGRNAPNVVDASGVAITDEKKIVSGHWARMSFNLFAYENKKVGVSCGLLNVMVLRADEPFGSGQSEAKDDFGPLFAAGAESKAKESDEFFA